MGMQGKALYLNGSFILFLKILDKYHNPVIIPKCWHLSIKKKYVICMYACTYMHNSPTNEQRVVKQVNFHMLQTNHFIITLWHKAP
jgi:hypothetical protein